MVFSSITFLYYFLPATLLVYFLVPKKLKNAVMFLSSMVFYAWGEIRFVPFMILVSIEDYFSSHKMAKYADQPRKKRAFFALSLGCNLALLGFFKYADFFIHSFNGVFGTSVPALNILLPIGVSFNTFQSISYAIDVYRGTIPPADKYFNYLTYTTLFPQIVAGPVVRYVTVGDELSSRSFSADDFSVGIRRFLVGLGKKVLIANNIGSLWDSVQALPQSELTVGLYWLGILAFTLQIYFDFSGYSDMAIGLARIFGLTFLENFNYPYISQSITEFWRRWHMTLGAWFRDYVYIPLGGNRCSRAKQVRNILAVWALTGLWHGASWNFVLWGVYFAALLLLEKLVLFRFWEKVPRMLRHLYALFFITLGWVIFSFESVGQIGAYFAGMFGLGGVPAWSGATTYALLQYGGVFVLAAVLCIPWGKALWRRLGGMGRPALAAAATAGCVLLLLACTAYLVNSTYNPFLYFRF